jgi:hypothetical protein
MVDLFPAFPDAGELSQTPFLLDLFVTTSKHFGVLNSVVPLLQGTFRPHEQNVLLEHLILNAKSSQDFGHLNKGSIHLPELVGLDYSVTLDFNLSLDTLNLIFLFLISLLLVVFGHQQLFVSMGEAGSSPSHERSLKLLPLEHAPEVAAYAFSFIVEVLLSGSHSDPAEHLNTQGAASDCADHIDSILLSLYVFSPGNQYLALFIRVSIVDHSVAIGVISLVEAALKVVSLQALLFEVIPQTLSFVLLF